MPRLKRSPPPPDRRQRTYMREWRLASPYNTQTKLAEALEGLAGFPVSDGQLSRIERGEQPYTQDLLEALAVVFRCEPSDIIRRRPDDPKTIETAPAVVPVEGLEPGQVELVRGMVEQLRRTGTGG